jgi:excisionase family DNA binding protein
VQYYKTREAVEYLGLDLNTVRDLTREGYLACLRPTPKRTLYARADLDAFKASWKRLPAVKQVTEPVTNKPE